MKTAAALAALSVVGCGYQLAGQADTIPDEVRTIAVPAFTNTTTEFKIEQHLTGAIIREFISRTRYEVVNDEEAADAVVRGAVVGLLVFPATFDPQTGRATTINTITQLQVALWDRKSGEKLYDNPRMEIREQYEVSADPDAYFEERQAALIRASETAARTVVSAVLEGF